LGVTVAAELVRKNFFPQISNPLDTIVDKLKIQTIYQNYRFSQSAMVCIDLFRRSQLILLQPTLAGPVLTLLYGSQVPSVAETLFNMIHYRTLNKI
jgi:hypothetical protein